jgi:DUF1680 family protein
MELNGKYLMSLEPDRFLHTFRITAGLPSNAKPYGGWEAPASEVRGHSLGHYLSALALHYASTGEAAFKERADYIVAELAKCQEALPGKGANPGYLSAYPESFIDRVEAGNPVWAPYYTLHKIMAGLVDAHQYCSNAQALAVVSKMADWVKFRMDRLTPEQQQRTLRNEFGGMNDVLAILYDFTRNPEHLRLSRVFDHKAVFDPLAARQDKLDSLHANTQIPKFIGAARDFELTAEKRYGEIARYSWERVALHRSYVIGGHSDREHFFPVNQFARHLSSETTETCNTYNMLKLSRHVFGLEPSAPVMDFYERALYNHILASQEPGTGMYTYLVPLKSGHFKTYSTPHDSFWCCVGTGMENHTRYGEAIYFHSHDVLWVNLFIASELKWAEKGLLVRQVTGFPESETTRLSFHCDDPVKLAVKVRWPAWAPRMIATINGKPAKVTGAAGHSYVTFEREWQDGDRLEIQLPMRLRVEPLPGTTNIVSLLYGPLVLAGQLGREGLDNINWQVKGQLDLARVPTPRTPVFVLDRGNLVEHVKRLEGKQLAFATKGLGRPKDVELIPFYRLHHERYAVYWPLYSSASWSLHQKELADREAAQRSREARFVDAVNPGEQQSETDHGFKGERTAAGVFSDRHWRHAENGWFSYELKVLPGQPQALLCTYWGSDGGRRTFDVLVDGRKIATQTLNQDKPGEFFDREHPLPADLLEGKQRVTVRFQAHPDHTAGGVFHCAIVKAAK